MPGCSELLSCWVTLKDPPWLLSASATAAAEAQWEELPLFGCVIVHCFQSLSVFLQVLPTATKEQSPDTLHTSSELHSRVMAKPRRYNVVLRARHRQETAPWDPAIRVNHPTGCAGPVVSIWRQWPSLDIQPLKGLQEHTSMSRPGVKHAVLFKSPAEELQELSTSQEVQRETTVPCTAQRGSAKRCRHCPMTEWM